MGGGGGGWAREAVGQRGGQGDGGARAGEGGGWCGSSTRAKGVKWRGLTRCGCLKNLWSGGWTWARKRGGASLETPGYA